MVSFYKKNNTILICKTVDKTIWNREMETVSV